jgi:RNA polymerase sigma factor (sigma-70 family)
MDLAKYYTEICREPMLTREQEETLFLELKNSKTSAKRKEAIRDHVIRANLRYAFKEAKKFSKNDPSIFEDLICAANDGLLAGFEKYDPSTGYRYLSYAGWWVKQRILKEMAKMRLVSLPIWKQQLAAKIKKYKEDNPRITIAELKKLLPEVSEKDIIELSQTQYLTYYIDDMDENEFEVDVIGDSVQRQMDDEKVWKAVASLPSPHREVIARSAGLEDGEEYTPAQLAKMLKLPKEEIKRVKTEGLKMLKDILGKKEAYLGR